MALQKSRIQESLVTAREKVDKMEDGDDKTQSLMQRVSFWNEIEHFTGFSFDCSKNNERGDHFQSEMNDVEPTQRELASARGEPFRCLEPMKSIYTHLIFLNNGVVPEPAADDK